MRWNSIIGLSFILYIGSFGILQLLSKDRVFSELENRTLAKKPVFTKESFVKGEYGKAFEVYISDQFPGRDDFIQLKSYSELLQGKRDNNGVYLGQEGYLLQKFNTPDEVLLQKNAGYINALAEDFRTYVMIVPTATQIYEDKLPRFAASYSEQKFMSDLKKQLKPEVQWIEVLDTLSSKQDESIYYKTDHHWTTLGAYYGYEAFCKTYGIEPLPLEQFDRLDASKSFYGSLFSKGNFTFLKPDTLQLFREKNRVGVEVTNRATHEVTDTLYDREKLETKDKYGVFLGGNHPLIVIKTGNNNGKKIAVIKDSYANSMVSFLTNHFEEIHLLDLRFINIPISQYLAINKIEEVLLLYNAQNFAIEDKLSLLVK